MPITVYFATNRKLSGPPERLASYTSEIAAPTDPSALTFGTAFVTDCDLTADVTGAIENIQDVSKGRFGDAAAGDLSDPGRNLLVFVHGFDNSFENAITRAAFNQQWFARSGVAGAETTVVAFSWPSLGQLLSFPVLWADYQRDQTMAGQSGPHLMSFLASLEPILRSARKKGRRSTLLAHSMGNLALAGGVESWFSHGNGAAPLFDQAVLAAADERYDTFGFPLYGRLSGLAQLSDRIAVCFSRADLVLSLSSTINLGAQRLGQQGPSNRSDEAVFPPARYVMQDCSEFTDYDIGFSSSHQYYRRSPGARAVIAPLIAGA